jgi:hypothetical protein
MGSEEATISTLSSPVGRLALWRIRMSGILYIVIALFLFILALAPGVLANVPSYVVVILIALPIVAGIVLFRFAAMLAHKTVISGKAKSKDL